jgi:hypothetical protein
MDGASVSRAFYGNPTKDGLFSMRFKLPLPAAYAFKGRALHRDFGTFRMGMGEKADPSKREPCWRKASSHLRRAPHFVSVDEEMVVQLNNLSRLPQEKRT